MERICQTKTQKLRQRVCIAIAVIIVIQAVFVLSFSCVLIILWIKVDNCYRESPGQEYIVLSTEKPTSNYNEVNHKDLPLVSEHITEPYNYNKMTEICSCKLLLGERYDSTKSTISGWVVDFCSGVQYNNETGTLQILSTGVWEMKTVLSNYSPSEGQHPSDFQYTQRIMITYNPDHPSATLTEKSFRQTCPDSTTTETCFVSEIDTIFQLFKGDELSVKVNHPELVVPDHRQTYLTLEKKGDCILTDL